MSGGASVTGNKATSSGGGVYITGSNSTFTMSGGEISGNEALGVSTNGGGGVYMAGGTFNMSDGIIGGTYPSNTGADGGGVKIAGGTFNMSGSAKVSGNIGTNYGGGVVVNGKFNMRGGEISGNSTPGGGGGVRVISSGVFQIENGTIYGSDATISSLMNTKGGSGYAALDVTAQRGKFDAVGVFDNPPLGTLSDSDNTVKIASGLVASYP
jgi:hypothetical protein